MKVLISPNAFKGTINAQKAGEIIADFISENFNEVVSVIAPIADGGDGTCNLLTHELKYEEIKCWSLNAYGSPIASFFGWDQESKKAFIDISTASGIGSLGGKELNPEIASSYGTGILIREAINYGAIEIVLGLGGSATIDLGIGILAALGIEFLDNKGRSLTLFSPNYLKNICHIQRTPKIPKVKFTFLCDVKNQLFGEHGAIPVFGPQKGLKKEMFEAYAIQAQRLINELYLKSNSVFLDQPGFGAAGGIAAGLSPFFNTDLIIGSTYFFEQIDLKSKIAWADLVITGEGRYDSQSREGKASFEILLLSKLMGKKTALITTGNDGLKDGFEAVFSLPDLDFSKENLKALAEENLRITLQNSLSTDFWS